MGGMRSQYFVNGRWLTPEEAYPCPGVRFNPRTDRIARDRGYHDAWDGNEALRQSIQGRGILNSIL
jgi:hypothetical protein